MAITLEIFLSEIAGAEAYPTRHMSMESLHEHGSRRGLAHSKTSLKTRTAVNHFFGVAKCIRTQIQKSPKRSWKMDMKSPPRTKVDSLPEHARQERT